MTLTRVRLERFTAFDSLDLSFSPGINVFAGENGTGKTHLMKVCYAACDISKTHASFAGKLIEVFLPSDRTLGRLVSKQSGSERGVAEVHRDGLKIRLSFSRRAQVPGSAAKSGEGQWINTPIESVYILVKEMLANAPGFRSLYGQREIRFEAVYDDIASWNRKFSDLTVSRLSAI